MTPLPFSAILGFIISLVSMIVSLAGLLLVAWQGPRQRENQLVILYLASTALWSFSNFMLRFTVSLGQDPLSYLYLNAYSAILNGFFLFTFTSHYAGFWNRRWMQLILLAAGAATFGAIFPVYRGELITDLVVAPGMVSYRFTPPGYMYLLAIILYNLLSAVFLWAARRERSGRLVPAGVIVVVGVLLVLVPALRVYTPGNIAATFAGILFTYAILRDRLFNPLAELNSNLTATNQRLQTSESDLRAQKELFENLVAVARATTEQPTLEATLRNALNVMAAFTQADSGDLFLLDDRGVVAHSLLTHGLTPPPHWQERANNLMDRGLSGWVARHRQSALIADTLQDERWLTLPGAPSEARSALSAPISHGATLLGVLTLTHSAPEHFSDQHLRLVEAAADQMALALHNVQIFDAQRQMADRQAALYGVLSAVSSQLDPEAVVRLAAETIAQLAGWPNLAIGLLAEDGQHWRVAAAAGRLAQVTGQTFDVSQGVVGRTFTTAYSQYVPDVSKDADYVAIHPAIRSELAVPLLRRGRLLGVLNVESDQIAAFNADDMLLAELLGDAVALALDNARLHVSVMSQHGQLDALIKSGRDGIMLIGLDLKFRVINQTALRLLRLPNSPEDWIDRSITEVLRLLRGRAPAVARAMLAEMRRIQRGDEPPGKDEYEMPPYTVLWLNLPVLSGNIRLGRLLVLRDVTEERRLSRKLAAAHAQLDDLLHRFVPSAVADRLIADPTIARPGGERREVTILFADLRGFTRWSEQQAPEAIIEQLNRQLSIGIEIMLAEGGTVDKIMGDALMVIFNAPTPQADHAQRAVRAAQAMLESLPSDAALSFSVGINTGEAVAGNVGAERMMNYTVIGDAVNQARRLQELAQPGQILISETTYALVQGQARVNQIGAQLLRGRERAVMVYEII